MDQTGENEINEVKQNNESMNNKSLFFNSLNMLPKINFFLFICISDVMPYWR